MKKLLEFRKGLIPIISSGLIIVAILFGNTKVNAQPCVSLTTTFAGGNGQSGNMFDIVATNQVTITSFEGNLNAGIGTVEIWYRTGSFVGFETSNIGWTQLGSATVTSAGNGSGTPIPIPVNVIILPGNTVAFYVTNTNGVAYTNGTALGNVFVSDAYISVLEGNGGAYFDVNFSPRVFNGVIHYSCGPPADDDVGVIAIDAPGSDCSLTATESVTIRVKNFGIDAQDTIPVAYAIGGSPVVDTIFALLNPGDTVTFTFSTLTNLSTPGTYIFDAWTSLVTDSINFNDSLTNFSVDNIPIISTFLYFEDFESGSGAWSSGGANSSWAYGTPSATFIPGAASGTNAWVTNLSGTYNDNEFSYLESPCLDFSSLTVDPILRFSHIFTTEPCCDEGWVEYSTNGGTSWTKLGTASSGGTNWYNDTVNDWWDDNSGTSGVWRTAEHELTGLAGLPDVRIRFVFSTDGSVTDEGFGVDDIYISDPLPDDVGVIAIDAPTTAYSLSASENVTVSIKNFGINSQDTIPVSYRINGGTPVIDTLFTTLNSNDTISFTFSATAGLSVFGTYVFDAWTSLSTDLFTISDSVTNHQVINDSNIIIGYGTSTNTNTTYPAPYGNWFWGAKHQIIIRATELASAGMLPGLINGLAFDVAVPQGVPLQGFTIQMKNTTDSVTTGTFDDVGLTTVWGPQTYTETAGWNFHTFSPPFYWNGTSNLLIETCFNNSSYTYNAEHYYTPTSFNSVVYANQDASGVCAVSTGFTSVNRPNMKFDWSPPAPIDAGITEITSPSTGCLTNSETVTVNVQNFGSDTIFNIDVYYSINGGPPVMEPINDTILPSSDLLYSFSTPADLSLTGIYVIDAWTQLTGDTVFINDSLTNYSVENTATVADFTVDYIQNCTGGIINFTDLSTNSPFSWKWEFGDGGNSTLPNPSYSYADTGTYTVTLFVTNACNTDTLIMVDYIEITEGPKTPDCTPTVLDISNDVGIYNVSFNTINNTTGALIEGYQDYSCFYFTTVIIGSRQTLSVQTGPIWNENVSVWIDYNNDSTFNDTNELVFASDNHLQMHSTEFFIPQNVVTDTMLRMRVNSDYTGMAPPGPCSQLTYGQSEDYGITIQPNTSFPTEADFTYTILDECQGIVEFNDYSSYFPSSWLWDFGDGNSDSASPQVTNTYSSPPSPGTYNVTLIVTNSFGSDTVTKSITIRSVIADFAMSADTVYSGDNVSFTENSTGANSWLWDFGDGTTSTDPNFVHTYDSVGIDTVYTVLLTAINTVSGCSDTISKQIVVTPPLPSGIIASENNNEMITIVPVPSSGILYVNYVVSGLRDINVSIYDLLGQKIYTEKITVHRQFRQMIDLSDKPKGIYFVKFATLAGDHPLGVIDKEKQVVRKIILE